MKDLLKTYSPVAFVLAGALGWWSIGTVAALKETVVELREQNKNIIIGLTNNCEALIDEQGRMIVDKPAEEVEEDAGSADTSN